MRSYGQYCPIARGSEIFAERWTPIILRNILAGCRTFSEISAGAPGLSRALLTTRLRELERVGVITAHPKPDGRGFLYEPTPAGEGLRAVLHTLGAWADQWMELTYEHSDPAAVLWSWSNHYLERDRVPDGRVVVRFEWTYADRTRRTWLLIERREAEICPFDPGFGDDLIVVITEPLTFARWHVGLVDWEAAVRSGAVQVTGPTPLRRALPTWNRGPLIAAGRRMARESEPAPSTSLAGGSAATGRPATLTQA